MNSKKLHYVSLSNTAGDASSTRKRFGLRTAAACLLVCATTAGPSAAQSPTIASWQTSVAEFVDRVRQREAGNEAIPLSSMNGLSIVATQGCGGLVGGGNFPEYGTVRFSAEFMALTPITGAEASTHKAQYRADFNWPASTLGPQGGVGVGLYVYPAASSVEAWRAVAASTQVEFTAGVK